MFALVVNGDITIFPCVDNVSSLLDVDWLDQSNGRPIGQARSCGSAALHWADSRLLPSSTGLLSNDQQ